MSGFVCIDHKVEMACDCYGLEIIRLNKALTLAIEALEKIQRGQNKVRSTGMDTPSIAVSRDQLRMWAIEALIQIEKLGEGDFKAKEGE